MKHHYKALSLATALRCFLLAMGLALSSSVFALSGTYTIDPSGSGGSNYTSLSAAVSALNSGGASGDVTFVMASATFTGGVTINAFSGSGTHNVTFVGAGVSSTTIRATSGYCIYLNGADKVTFRDMTIAASSSCTRAVYVYGLAEDNSFRNCTITQATTTSSSYTAVYAYRASTNNNPNGLTIDSCKVTGGYYAIYIRGYGSSTSTGYRVVNPTVSNSEISGFYYYGMYLYYTMDANILNNTFDGASSYRYARSFYMVYGNASSSVSKMRINGNLFTNNCAYAMYISSSDGYGTSNRSEIYNNVIHGDHVNNVTYSSYCYVLPMYSSDYWEIYHNSFASPNSTYSVTSANYSVLYCTGTYCDVQNNSFISSGVYPMYLSNSTSSANYNNYYNWKGSATAYAASGSTGANSVSVDQGWSALDDLDIKDGCVNGNSSLGITSDHDGNTRSTPPDMGAYEASSGNDDAGVVEILSPVSPLSSGTQTVRIAVKNFGGNNITQLDGNYQVGTSSVVTDPLSLTTPMAPCDLDTFTISTTFTMTSGCQDFKAFTSDPNLNTDSETSNDTLKSQLGIGASGTFTVGGSGADFTNLAAAFASLNCAGVGGPVVFKLGAGTHTGQVEIPAITGTSSTNTITVIGAGRDSTILTYGQSSSSGDRATLLFNGCSYVTFRDMTIRGTGTYAFATQFRAGNYNSIRNCAVVVTADTTGTSSSTGRIPVVVGGSTTSYSSGGGITGIVVDSCDLNGGYFNYTAYASSNTSTHGVMTITNCSFRNGYYYGIYMRYVDGANIVNNSVMMTRYNYQYTNSVYIYNYFVTMTNPIVFKNNVIETSGYGPYFYYCVNPSSNPGEIMNNMISSSQGIYGMTLYGSSSSSYGSDYWNIYHNTINLYGSSSSTRRGLYIYYNNYTDVRNNIFNVLSGSSSSVALYNNYSPGSTRVCDYNVYNTEQTYLIYSGGNRTSSNLNTYSSSGDQNSVATAPTFTSNTDLHLSDACFLRGPNLGVSTDFDGDSRSSSPHVGADEIPTPALDAGIEEVLSPIGTVSSGNQTVVAVIKNFGTTALTSVTMNYQVGSSSAVTESYTLSSSLATCALDTFTFTSTYNHTKGCAEINVWTNKPNNSTDGYAPNDTASAEFGIPMSGTYTIGGSSPDFPGFDDAFRSLNCAGISGPVIFEVRSGTYSVNRTIANVSGMSATDTILFKSAPGNATLPILEHDASSTTDNYVIQFSNASYWSFDSLHLRSKNGSYGRVVEFINTNNHIRFTNCTLEGVSTTTSSNYMAVVYDNSGTSNMAENITFTGNTFLNGSSSLFIYGGSSSTTYQQENWVVTNNTMRDFYYYGNFFYYMNGLIFHGNNVSASSPTSYMYGLYLYYSDNSTITSNRIHSLSGTYQYGIYNYFSDGSSSSSPALLANNFIQVGRQNGYGVALYLNRSRYVHVYHNSFHSTGTYSSSSYPCVYLYGNSSSYAGCDLKNNIIANTGGGYSLYHYSTTYSYISSDYNCIYSTSTGSHIYSGSFYSSVSAYSSARSLDGNSIESDPKFYTDTDLHCISGALDSAGTYLTSVTMDIDGETRRNPNPSIGADEYTAIDDDAGISNIVSPTVLCSSNSVTVTLKNFGEATLGTATINWKVNGTTQTPYSFSGSLASGGSMDVTIGTFSASGSVAIIEVWTSGPNGKTDLRTSNDAFMKTFNAGLSGTYTVGGTSPDFVSLTDAINAASSSGICGSVVFNVRQGTYTEKVSIGPIPGSDPSNTLTIQSDPSNTAMPVFENANTGSTNNHVIEFKGCSYVTVNGLHLKNTGTNQVYTTVINTRSSGTNQVHHITVKNCKLEGITSTYTGYYGAIVSFYYYIDGANVVKDFTLENNSIINGGFGVYNYGYSSTPNERIMMKGNTITGHNYMSIYSYYSDSCTIMNNTIDHGGAYTSYLYGIYSNYCDVHVVTGNDISIDRQAGNSYIYGMHLRYCDSSITVERNSVDVTGNTTTTYMYASYFYYCDAGATNHNRIVNNMFTVSSTNTSAYQIGCYLYNCRYTDFLHNNVSINGGPSLSTGGIAMYPYVTSSIYGPLEMRNNIFHAAATNSIGLYANGTSTYYGTVNNNCVWADYYGVSWSGVWNSHSSYQSGTGWDAQGVNMNPMFTSTSDLHVNNHSLFGTGGNIGITDDFDSDSRDTMPTIGAHEIDPDLKVVGVSLDTLCGDANTMVNVMVTLENTGDVNQSDIPVSFMVDANAPVSDTISATLAPGAMATFTLTKTADLSGTSDHTVQAYSDRQIDVNRANDTVSTMIPYWPYPMASFTNADSCKGDAMSFTSTATISSGTTTSTWWNFGDGNSSSMASPTNTYTNAGSYTVTHVSTSNNGCTDTVMQTINVLTELLAGSISANQTICYGKAPATFGSIASASGSGGNYQYQWQMSSDNATWSDISGATSETYSHGTMTADMYFRRAVSTDVGCGPSYTSSVKVTVYDMLVAGTIGSDQTICYNTVPAMISQSTAPTGGAGGWTYQWQMSSDNSNWSDISGATTTSYSPGTLKATTYYRLVYTASMSCGVVESSSIRVMVYDDLTAGVVGSDHRICPDGTPKLLTVVTAGTGGDGNYTYQWQTSSNGTSWSNISGATSSTYQETGTFTSEVYYRRMITSGSGCGTRTSNRVRVRIAPLPVSKFILANHCFNDIMPVTNNSTVSSGSITDYLWDFGDGNSSTLKKPSHVYKTDGTKTVQLLVTTNIGCKDSSTQTVKVSNIPTPAFTSVYQCSTDSMFFKNATSVNCGKISAFYWEFGDGSTSTAQNPAHLYTAAGTYNVKFKIFLPGGFQDSTTRAITIAKEAVSNFTVDDHCFGDSARFVNTTTNGVSYSWDFDDNNTSTSVNPVHFYRVTGTYSVTLIATDGNKCNDTTTKSVTVKVRPSADFTTDDRCVNTPVPLDNGTIYAHTYVWDFGDGTTSTDPTRKYSHTYTKAGKYDIVLYANNNNGCKDTTYGTVTVFDNPTAKFSASDGCSGKSVSFTNNSTDNKHNTWTFGDGNSSSSVNPTHTYNSPVTYTVKLLVESDEGCFDSTQNSVVIHGSPSASFTASNVCEGDAMNFTNTSTGAGTLAFAWDFDNGSTSTATNPSNTYSASGQYDVILKVVGLGNCEDSDTITVEVYDNPTVTVADVSACLGSSVTMSSTTSNATSYAWSLGDGTTSSAQGPTHTYTSAGTYNLTLDVMSKDGCKAQGTGTATIHAKPSVTFSATDVCEGNATQFTNTSSSSVTSYSWTFGDGNSSTTQNPAHTYAHSGTFKVSLSGTTANGCSASTSRTVNVYGNPTADFTGSDECYGTATSFTNHSTGASTYAWDFGDGNSSAATAPTNAYSKAGTYVVKLTATNGNNCSDSKTSSVVVYETPTVDFYTTDGCAKTDMKFYNKSSAGSYVWSFGDGYASSADEPTHRYKAKGTYTANLKVTSTHGCTADKDITVNVYGLPTASFDDVIGCAGKVVNFNNTSVGATTYGWDFGNTYTSNLKSPTHTYTNSGTYNVTLVATNSDACEDRVTKAIVIYDNPTVAFTANDVCNNTAVQFTSTSSSGVHNWDFGDNTTSIFKSPSHLYTVAKAYSVTLEVASAQGCKSSLTKTVNVWPNPKVDFKADPQCSGTSVILTNTSTISSGTMSSSWNYGDGSNGTTNSHTYGAAGFYTITLNATSDKGCFKSIAKTVGVYNPVTADFSAIDVCDGKTMPFTNLSKNATSLDWDFGDGNSSKFTTPSHKYSASGTYTVNLAARNPIGCLDQVSKKVRVISNPDANFTFTGGCTNSEVHFTNTTPVFRSALWDFGDGNTSTGDNASHKYTSSGTRTVLLRVTNTEGCTDIATSEITIYEGPMASFTVNNTCEGELTQFINTSRSSNAYNWVFGDGNTSNNTNPTNAYASPGSYSAMLIATNANCADTMTTDVVINATPNSGFTFNRDGREVQFIPTTTGASGYDWDFDDGNTSTSESPLHNYSKAVVQTFNVCLRVTDDAGCNSESCNDVTIDLLGVAEGDISDIKVYPNPNRGTFTVHVGEIYGDLSIELTDVNGKLIREINTNQSTSQYTISMQNTATGVYVVHVKNGDRHSTQRVMVTR